MMKFFDGSTTVVIAMVMVVRMIDEKMACCFVVCTEAVDKQGLVRYENAEDGSRTRLQKMDQAGKLDIAAAIQRSCSVGGYLVCGQLVPTLGFWQILVPKVAIVQEQQRTAEVVGRYADVPAPI